jgi:SSS family solute:Na+ symporter
VQAATTGTVAPNMVFANSPPSLTRSDIARRSPPRLDLILYAYTFGAAGLFFPMLGLLFWPRTTSSGAFWSMLGGGLAAVLWVIVDEPWGLASSYIGWFVSLPILVIVSLSTRHSANENPELFN